MYHGGELSVTLPQYTQGDFVTCLLDMDSRTLSFGKNGEQPRVVFEDMDAAELYPCVMFYSTNPGEKVSMFRQGLESQRCFRYEKATGCRVTRVGDTKTAPG